MAPGIVGAAVVDRDDLEPVARIARGGDRRDRAFDHRALVVGRDDDAQQRRVLDGSSGKRAIAQPENRAHEKKDQSHGDPDHRRADPQLCPFAFPGQGEDRLQERRGERGIGEQEHSGKDRRDQQQVPRIARRVRPYRDRSGSRVHPAIVSTQGFTSLTRHVAPWRRFARQCIGEAGRCAEIARESAPTISSAAQGFARISRSGPTAWRTSLA